MVDALRRVVTGAGVAVLVSVPRATVPAQMTDSLHSRRVSGSVRVQAMGLVTRVDPAVAGRARTEGYLVQPIVMARGSVFRGALSGVLTLDFEGLTLDRGQLTPGSYGEGYADRRHPHTYLHEAMVVAAGAIRNAGVSLAVGKGFVPFGTDDPMMRPFATYPVNHHLAQILERYVAIGGLRVGRFVAEGAVFNGDEPQSPGAPPDADRFGDSWAARAALAPTGNIELQGSYAFVNSPEISEGAGLDQRKWSAAARLDRPAGPIRYALVEWARTDAMLGDFRTNSFTSFLAEASATARSVTISGRFENSTRPEEQRLLDPFRTSRAPADLGIIGITRWHVGTAAASVSRTLGRLDVAPFAEVSYSRPSEELTPTAFVPRDFYGATAIWMMSAGVRLGVGPEHRRMGRYGVGMPNVPGRGAHVGH